MVKNERRGIIIIAIVLGSAAMLSCLGPARATEITAERSDCGALVKIDGQLFTEYITDSAGKPILWPLIGPTGKPVTRPWPMAKACPHDQQDHPHQRSLWFTHGEVNGINWIDFDITIKATNGPVTFGDTKEGAFGVRVAGTMTVDAKQGGQIVNSHGQTDGKAWGQPAEWVDYHGPRG